MADFRIEIAGAVFTVCSLFDSTKDYCRDYLTEKDPDFTLEVSGADLVFEQQALDEIKDPVKKFEILFRDYSAKKLQKVIDGRDYLPEAKKAAQNLLRRKGE